MLDLIEKKKMGGTLTREELNYWTHGAAHDTIPDYQSAALLMAIRLRGMTPEETRDMTMAMAESGDMLDLTRAGGICVDKHSTGGVGDTTTLVLAPLVAACGGKVAKMSGRGLGHTGGTLDKIESIPGCRIDLTEEQFITQVRDIGCAVMGQTGDLVPADKALYALRDATATVDSLPLIAASIMSKKIASGAHAIVLDVKTGSGALMPTLDESIELARAMVEVGRLAGRRPTEALVTGMEQPLGTHIGNALEVKEAIDTLAGRVDGRLLTVSLRLGAMMLVAGGYASSEKEAIANLKEALKSGKGLDVLAQMIEAQGGNPAVTRDVSLLPHAKNVRPVLARRAGYITRMDTRALGSACQRLGAGRLTKADVIDPAAGVVMAVEIGDIVQKGDPLLYIHKDGAGANVMAHETTALLDAIEIADRPARIPPLVYAVVRKNGKVERFS